VRKALRVSISPSAIDLQIKSLQSLKVEPFLDEINGYLSSIGDDLVFGDGVIAPGTSSPSEIVYTPRLGARFESLVSTCRAGKLEV